MMEHEHDSASNALRAMRKASHDFALPQENARISYRTLYGALQAFETAYLHQHIHLENNIRVFRGRSAMEKSR